MWILTSGVLLAAVLLVGVGPAAADPVFSDGFESGDFSAWSQVQAAGDGTAVVQSAIVSTGLLAARLSESSATGSKAYVRKTFASAQLDLSASGDFQVLQQGASGGNVPLFRFLDPSSARLVSVYRQNGTSGSIGVTYGGSHFSTTGTLALNTWATVAVHLIANGTSSAVEVRLNGALIYQTGSASLGTSGVSTVQLGNDTAAQPFTIVADTINVQNGASSTPSPPVNSYVPTISGTAQDGQTLNASPGSWTGTQPISYAYQWQRCDSSGANCGPIDGATSATYQVVAADVGGTLRVAVAATNSVGSATATSNPTAIVQSSSNPPDLVALWHMDEASGATMYDAIAGHNGTAHNVQLGVPGFSGTAYGFNGSSSYVSVPSSSDLNPGSSDITVTIRLRTTGTPPPSPVDWDLIRKGNYDTSGGEYKMEFQESGQASCGFKGSANYGELIAGPAINDGQWHTIQCVKTASAIRLIVDGQTFSQAANIGSIANTEPVTIGAHPGSDWYQGSLDEASIAVQSGPALTADFTGSPTSGVAPLGVSFTDTSTGGPTSWSWDFGDGSTSVQQNPSHTYSAAGTYSVTLSVSNGTGSATTTKANYVTASQSGPALTADFTGSPTSGVAPLGVSFTDTSTGGPTSWSWDFGDGSTSVQQNPSHTYSAARTYSVTLSVSNGTGSATTTKANYVTVTAPPADFAMTVSPSSAVVVMGGTASYTTTLTLLNGFAGAVDLSVTGLPPSSTASFSLDPVNLPASTSTLIVGTSSTTKPGNYTLTVTGTSGGLTHTSTVTLQTKRK
jgi:PKD repeat protein